MRLNGCRAGVLVVALAVLVGLSLSAYAREWKVFESEKYGYSLKIPAEFKMEGKEDKTTSWIYQPGAAGGKKGKKSKKFKIGARIKGISVGHEVSESQEGSGGGGLESALSIYVNWVWMPDVDSGTMYSSNKKSDKQNMDSPDPDYKDLVDFDKKKDYAYEGHTYWYKEVDKDGGDEIHRWHIKSYGNKSAYTVGLCGTYAQFEEWGPVYEEIIKSWKLIPMKK